MTSSAQDRPAAATMRLRVASGLARARVHWPAAADAVAVPALLVFLHATPDDGDALCRGLCSQAGIVVLSACCPGDPCLRDATAVVGWAADHAAELEADPGRLLVAGEGSGGGLAAAVALRARARGWPSLTRQLLILPRLLPLRTPSLAGVAPAMVITDGHDPGCGDGRRYAAWLRQAGVPVDELRYDDLRRGGVAGRMLTDLSGALRRALATNP